MTRFIFEKSNHPNEQYWSYGSEDSKLKFEFGRGPRLVGGTTFVKQASLDQSQVKLLADAASLSMEETLKTLSKWRQQGQSLEDIYIDGIAQAARLIGELWSSDELDFANGNIAYSHLHLAMLELSSEFLTEGRTDANGLNLLLMTEPGAHHRMGAFMLGEFFRRSGWRVTLATPQDIGDFKRLFLSDWFDAVVLSISTDRHLDPISKVLHELNQMTVNPNLKMFVGGPMAHVSPDRLNWAGTVLLQSEAVQTVEIVTQAMDTPVHARSDTPQPT